MKIIKFICITLLININSTNTMLRKTLKKGQSTLATAASNVLQSIIPEIIPSIPKDGTVFGHHANMFIMPSLDDEFDFSAHYKHIAQSAYNTMQTIPEEFLALKYIESQHPSGPLVSLAKAQYYWRNTIACYYTNKNYIELQDIFYKKTPSIQYMVLMHEYRHHLQYVTNNSMFQDKNDPFLRKKEQNFFPKEVLQAKKDNSNNDQWSIIEQDADHFATSNISCPTCLKINHASFINSEQKVINQLWVIFILIK